MWHPFGPQPSRFLRKSLLHWPALYCRAPLVIPSVGCLMMPVHTLKHRNQGKTRGLDRNTVRWCTRAASWYPKSLRRNIHIYDARMIGCGWHNTGTTMLCKWVPSFACFLQAWFHNIPIHVLFQTKLAHVENLTRGKWRDFCKFNSVTQGHSQQSSFELLHLDFQKLIDVHMFPISAKTEWRWMMTKLCKHC